MKALLLIYYNSKFSGQRQRKPTSKTQQKFRNFFGTFLRMCFLLHPSRANRSKSSADEDFSYKILNL